MYLIDTNQHIKNRNSVKNHINYFEKPIYLKNIKREIVDLMASNHLNGNEKIKINNHVLYPFKKKIFSIIDKEYISLTDKEVSILIKLIENNTIGKNDLLIDVWGYNTGIKTSTVETHIHRLRKKIGKFPVSKLEILTNKSGYSIK